MVRYTRKRIILGVVAAGTIGAVGFGACAVYPAIELRARAIRLHNLAYACVAYADDNGHYPSSQMGRASWRALGQLVPKYLRSAERLLAPLQPAPPEVKDSLMVFKGPGPLPEDGKISYWYRPPADVHDLMLAEKPGKVRTSGKLLAARGGGALVAMTESELREAIGPSLSED